MSSFIVSARKYRPTRFVDVVGQEHITNTLKNAIKSNHLAHSFLFCGPRGVGKTTCARILAKTINCENITAESEACDQCQSCVSFNNNSSFNIHELDAASNNSVDDIRQLIDQVRFAPQSGKYKIYIIDEVHMLSAPAFNAFLKTLEEPPSYAIFILATTERHKILPTILSRCQIFDFKRIMVDSIVGHLEAICKTESIEADVNGLHIIAQKSDGGLRDALSMFDRLVTFAGNKLTFAEVLSNLNVLDYDYYFRTTDQLLACDSPATMQTFDQVLRSGFDGDDFILGLADHFRSLFVLKDPRTAKLLEVSGELRERYENQALLAPLSFLVNGLRLANECDVQYKAAKNKRLLVELALMRMAYAKEAVKVASLPTESAEAKKKITNEPEPPLSKSAPQNSPDNIQVPDPVKPAESKPAAVAPSVSPTVKAPRKLLSLDDLEEQVEKEKEEDKLRVSNAVLEPIPVDEQALINCIRKYADQVKSSGNAGLGNILEVSPVSAEVNRIRLEASTDVVKGLIEVDLLNMMEHLRKELSNPTLQIEVVVTGEKQKEGPKLFTPKDKIDFMVRSNPDVRSLIEQLGLDLDY